MRNPFTFAKLVTTAAVLFLSGSALAHLHTPWLPQGEALRLGTHLVLVRVVAAGQKAGDGTETEVLVLAAVDGASPPTGTLRVWQEGAHRHALEPGALVFLPLVATPAGGWQYLVESRQPLRTQAAHQAIDRTFARTWRAQPPLELLDHPDAWLALLDHPAPLARAIALETLAARGPLLRPVMTPERIERLLAPTFEPGTPEEDRLTRLRLLEGLAGQAGAEAVARRFDRLPGERVRSAAAGLLARFASATTRAVLADCAAQAGALGARCTRLIAPSAPAP